MTHLLLAIIYLAFISLGLPDSLLGSAWPSMYGELGVPVSYAGVISAIISAGDHILKPAVRQADETPRDRDAYGAERADDGGGAVRVFGQPLLRVALPLGHTLRARRRERGRIAKQLCRPALCEQAHELAALHVGAGSLRRTLCDGLRPIRRNGLERRLPLHSPVLGGAHRRPADKPATVEKARRREPGDGRCRRRSLVPAETVRVPGAKETMAAFFCYCAVEQTAGLWAGSYLVLRWGMAEERAASLAGMFFIGITIGRALSGFLTMRLSDTGMVRLGQTAHIAGGRRRCFSRPRARRCQGCCLSGWAARLFTRR